MTDLIVITSSVVKSYIFIYKPLNYVSSTFVIVDTDTRHAALSHHARTRVHVH